MSNYYNTIPYFTCNAQTINCIANNPNDAAGQQTCIDSQEKFCSNYQNASDSSPVETLTSTATIVTTLAGGQLSTEEIAISFIQPAGVSIGQASASTTSSSQTSSSQTSQRSTSQTPQASNSSSPDSASSTDSGLSAGEIAAAVVVPVLGVLGIIAAVIILIRRRRSKKSASHDDEPWRRKELHGQDIPRKELPSSTRWEMGTDRTDHRHELEGDLSREKSEMAANEIAAAETSTGDTDRTR